MSVKLNSILVIGGGPAGLYFAYLMRKARPDLTVTVVEQNTPETTFGFGVSLTDRALELIEAADPQSRAKLSDALYFVDSQRIEVDGDSHTLHAPRPAGHIERLSLLKLLKELAEGVGVAIRYGERYDGLATLQHDLVVASDGANSFVREAMAASFGVRSRATTNRFAWYGTRRVFEGAGLTFRTLEKGAAAVAHYYAYGPEMSTFVAELDAASWSTLRFDHLTDNERREAMEHIFAPELLGEPLISNRSIWRGYDIIDVEHWSVGNVVLIGDALRPAHPSIGSGTRLALADAIALAAALDGEAEEVREALVAFERGHKPFRTKFNDAAERSIVWYENFREKMRLPIKLFVIDYMTRTGRITEDQLRFAVPDLFDCAQ
jgi:2-polyprenyl-6-methoxyphenol hydroxylase-like FAD-dependent oxidoreductase